MSHQILVAEDDGQQLNLLEKSLSRQGYLVDTAQNGLEALEKIKDKHPDLIISDNLMPGLNGIELFRKTLEICPQAIRILVTGYVDQDRIMNAINEANVYKFITKPWDLNQLLLTVRRALEHHDLIIQRVQTEKMATLGQLAAGVAHELNNPIGFVTSNIVTLSDYVAIFKILLAKYHLLTEAIRLGNPADEILLQIEELCNREDLPFILTDTDALLKETKEGADRIGKIVQNLKTFSRKDDDIKLVGINECIKQALNLIWNQLKYDCDVKCDLGHVPFIWCYPQRLQQVFINLIMNAVQAMQKRKGCIRIKTEKNDSQIVIYISDTGSGIAETDLPRIFDPFFTTKSAGEGTGLGLAISSEIIRSHGGKIEVESTLGKGTTFAIYLPIDGADAGNKSGVLPTPFLLLN